MYGKTVSDLCFYTVLCFAYKIHYAYSLCLSPTPTFRKQGMEIQCSLLSVIAFWFVQAFELLFFPSYPPVK